ncbi:hypothetical protein B4113_0371 [Geobacillus sp. B4113_201601]|nr:hypothetical protein B4113_0371 [Geobacillus sp. B4113_201601]
MWSAFSHLFWPRVFCENPTPASGDFHPRVEGKPLPMDLSVKMPNWRGFSSLGEWKIVLPMEFFCLFILAAHSVCRA